jgi:clan AA aspartic protease
MITGSVNNYLEITVRLVVRDAAGRDHEIECFIDTGYAGSLTLPSSVISAFALPWTSRVTTTLGDGSQSQCNVHAAIVIWDGKLRHVAVDAADTHPLLGMKMLSGFHLHIEAVPAGNVILEPLASLPP